MPRKGLPLIEAKTRFLFNKKMATRQVVTRDEGVRPSNLSSFTIEEYTLRNGFPYVAPLGVRAETVLSAEGEYALEDRPTPWDIDLPAQARFIPSTTTWDGIARKWQPASSQGVNYSFSTVPGAEPFLETITYRIGKELISNECLYFPPGAYLTSNFNEGIDDALEFSVVMVLSLENPTPYSILAAQSGDDRLDISINGEQVTVSVGNGKALVIPKQHPTQITPLYLVLSVTVGGVVMWMGSSPQQMAVGSASTGKTDVTAMSFQIGKDQFGNSDSNFRLLEWSLWPYALKGSNDEDNSVYAVLNKYSSIYGAL